MNPTLIHTQSGLSKLKLFFALYRTPHGLLDMATPALAALLWYGSFPPLRIIVLGLITAFAGGILLEAIYCIMWKSSWLKVLISGAVKTSGAMAAVFAIDPQPSFLPLILLFLFLWLFFWEIGGQNIPNDWADIEEDRILRATTIPVRFGPVFANGVIFFSLLLAVILNGISMGLLPMGTRFADVAASLGAGIYLLPIPAYRLYRTKGQMQDLALFNSANYYPITLLAVVIFTACT